MGVRGGGTSHIRVIDNSFTDFFPKPGDHPDAIQFWGDKDQASATGEKVIKVATDILIGGNVGVRGRGGIFQGAYLRDALGPGFRNVRIVDNTFLGSM